MKMVHVILLNALFFNRTPTDTSEVTFFTGDSCKEWSDAQKNCEQNGTTLAKIRGKDDLLRAKKTSLLTFSSNLSFWVGVKFNNSTGAFVWGDGTTVPVDADFREIVNSTRPSSVNSEKCMFISSNENNLIADYCRSPRGYICQSGENDDQGGSWNSTMRLTPSPTLLLLSSTVTPTLPTGRPNQTRSDDASISAEENLVNEYTRQMDSLNVNETTSLKRAVKITLLLLKNIRKIQHFGLKTNILLRFDKLEKFAFNYARFPRRFRAKIINSTEEISIQDEELVLQVLRIPADYNRSVVFRPRGTNITRSLTQNDENFIKLPSILFGTQERYTVCMWHNNVTGLLPRQANRIKDRKNVRIGSQIMSCSLLPKVKSVFADHVTFKLQNKKDSIKEKSDCVFWNFSISSRFNGAWSSEGCTLVEDSTETTTCDCNHLTNFAVLMEVGETEIPRNDKFALEIVTYVGTSFSLLGEVISISVYLFLLNAKSMQTHIRLNMVVCLAIAQVVFLTGITAIEQKTLCLSVAIAINYFYLVAFGWMVMEGVMLYLKVVKVFNVNTSRKYFYGFAWGFPTLLVTCAVAINTLIHGSMNTSMREDVCWFSFSYGFVWAFVGPVLVACLFNLAILSCVVVEILKLKDMPGTTDTNTIRQSLKACAVLSPLLGFTWMFGVLTVSTTAGLVFQYMFTILNSFQGFFIFAFHIVFNKETMTAWETRKKKWEIAWSPSLGNAKATSSPGEDRLPQVKERKSSRPPRLMNKIIPEEQGNDHLAPDLMNR